MDKNILRRLYLKKEFSVSDIALRFNLNKNTVIYWLRKYDIPLRNQKTKWTKRAINKISKRMGLNKNPNWKGGISFKRRKSNRKQGKPYKKFREAVLIRDEGRCVLCSSNQRLEVHHIFPLSKYKKFEVDPAYSLTLCRNCHKLLKNKEKRFSNFLLNIQKQKYEGGWYEWT